MTISCQITIDTDVFDAITNVAKTAPRAVDALVNRSIRGDAEKRLIPQLQAEPSTVVYPVAWTTERQRRAFFATNGFGAGIPTRRTGKTRAGWALVGEITSAGAGAGALRVENNVPAARYVYFPRQQQFHKNTGWVGSDTINRIVFEESEVLMNKLIDGWYSIVTFDGKLA